METRKNARYSEFSIFLERNEAVENKEIKYFSFPVYVVSDATEKSFNLNGVYGIYFEDPKLTAEYVVDTNNIKKSFSSPPAKIHKALAFYTEDEMTHSQIINIYGCPVRHKKLTLAFVLINGVFQKAVEVDKNKIEAFLKKQIIIKK